MNTFNLSILTADRVFYKGPCEHLMVPTLDGLYGIMANHSNVISAIVEGVMNYRLPGHGDQMVFVSKGLFKIENGDVLILVDSCERPEEIDEHRARRAEEEAIRLLKQKNSKKEYYMAQANLARAINRLKVKGRTMQ